MRPFALWGCSLMNCFGRRDLTIVAVSQVLLASTGLPEMARCYEVIK